MSEFAAEYVQTIHRARVALRRGLRADFESVFQYGMALERENIQLRRSLALADREIARLRAEGGNTP